jgi:hypothetical protein
VAVGVRRQERRRSLDWTAVLKVLAIPNGTLGFGYLFESSFSYHHEGRDVSLHRRETIHSSRKAKIKRQPVAANFWTKVRRRWLGSPMSRRNYARSVQVRWLGPRKKWCVVRNRDSRVIYGGFKSQPDANDVACDYETAVRIAFLLSRHL